MPFFATILINKPEMTPAHVRQQEPQKAPKKGQVRTNLPMTGGSKTTGTGTPTAVPTRTGTGGAPTTIPATGNGGSTSSGTSAGGDQETGMGKYGQVKMLIPEDAIPAGATESPGKTFAPQPGSNGAAANGGGGGGTPSKIKWIHENYFDAGAQDLIGTFTTLVLRYGVGYGQHDVYIYGRNETLDTRGTNLPFQSIVAGTSFGAAYRYRLPGNKAFFTVSDGQYVAGANKGKSDFRAGFATFLPWQNGHTLGESTVFSDLYADAFYIDIEKDVFLTARYRNGLVLRNTPFGVLTGYGVLQALADGKGDIGSTNRVEGGFGMGLLYGHYPTSISLNVELRAGYAYRGEINRRQYLNPSIVLSGSL